jgi:hypothetical protein
MCELTEDDLNICIKAVAKCQVINSHVKSGLTVTLTDKTFGFVDMSDDEELALIEKLNKAKELAWLKESRESK